MPRKESPINKLSYGWLRGEDWWGDPVSTNFLTIDMLLHPYILSMTEITPPSTGAVNGDMYLVPAGAVQEWAGHENQLAVYTVDGWVFAKPTRGVRARLREPSKWIWWNDTAWVDEDQGEGPAPPPLGSRYDIAMSVTFEAEPQEVLMVFTIPEAMTLPKDAAGSVARCTAAPVTQMRLSLKRNGADVGTILFVPTSVFATFTVAANAQFAANDVLTVHAPELPPEGFKNYAATLRLLLQSNGG